MAFRTVRNSGTIGDETSYPGDASWSIDSMLYHSLERERVKDNPLLFYVVASASFVEIASDIYARNLAEFFRGDPEVVDWLERAWEKEELQHGRALKRYVEIAWPDFDWDAAYRNFIAEFLPFCGFEQFAATRALEMVARCVVETGTATFYRALAETNSEPLLTQIATAISADEVRHYKHFYRFFLRYREREKTSRMAVARTLWSRMGAVDAVDAFYGFKHVYLARNPNASFRDNDYANFRAQLKPFAARHFPHRMASKMLLKPLDLSPQAGWLAVPAVASASRLLFLI
jgi:hypothetical protein